MRQELDINNGYLGDIAPQLRDILTRNSGDPKATPQFAESQIRRATVWVAMRDGIKLATDLYLPPVLPAPAIAARTPYGRARAGGHVQTLLAFAQRGYVSISQDCRGTGDSEPEVWDYWVYEPEDGIDFVEWVIHQPWYGGSLYSFGGSYVSSTQWCMAAHPRMSAIAPEVGGLQTTRRTVRHHMFVNAYPRSVGKGSHRLAVDLTEIERLIEAETMSTGYFNELLRSPLEESLLERFPDLRALPLSDAKRWLWTRHCKMPPAERAQLLKQVTGAREFTYVQVSSLTTVFDCMIAYGWHTIPSTGIAELMRRFHAPALIMTGWYEWQLGDQLASWVAFRREALPEVALRSRLIIGPSAHAHTGYHEGETRSPELQYNHRLNVDLLLRWFETIRTGTTDAWPTVIYYLMGANEWRTATDWPVPVAQDKSLYLRDSGMLSSRPPQEPSVADHDRYTYDPNQPTPTMGGSIVSFQYRPGSVDVSTAQRRSDVLTYTTEPLQHDLDVVGPLQMVLYASSSAVDTDFIARLSDVFPDGRAIQLQNGVIRARYRNVEGDPELLEPGRIYRFEIDMWAIANRFKAGHRIRVDISSADFPRFDRNTNRGGEEGAPVPAVQTVYHDLEHPSCLLLSIIDDARTDWGPGAC